MWAGGGRAVNKSAWDAHVAEHGEEPTGEDRLRIEREDAVDDQG